MSFEEEFPSLKDYWYITEFKPSLETYEEVITKKGVERIRLCDEPSVIEAKHPSMYKLNDNKVFTQKIIQKHCLDKQRVKEAINNCIHRNSENKDIVILAELYKELGLK